MAGPEEIADLCNDLGYIEGVMEGLLQQMDNDNAKAAVDACFTKIERLYQYLICQIGNQPEEETDGNET